MNRILLCITCVALGVATACGSDKRPAAKPAPSSTAGIATSPAATKAAPQPTATQAPASTDKALGSIFGTLFSSGALSGAANPTGDPANLPEGDPALKQYLLKASDFPPGYDGFNEFSSRVPDGLSTAGSIDFAASIATHGDIAAEDPTDVAVLMSMAMKPEDLQSLGEAFDSADGLTDQDLRDAISGSIGSLGGIKLSDVHVLDVSGLGDGAFGMSLSMDIGGLAETLAGQGAPGATVPKLNMKLYVFARGDYIGGIIHMSFGNDLSSAVDELALAHVVDAKLKSAP